MSNFKKVKYLVISVAVIIGSIFYFFLSRQDTEVIFLDVGQGDAILIKAPHNFEILIDGGPDNQVVRKLGQYLPFYDRQIELVILTHPHDDHLVGLVEVLERYQVKQIIQTGVSADNSTYEHWSKLIQEKNIKETIARAGQIYEIPGGRLSMLFPNQSLADQTIDDLNAASILIRLVLNQHTFLLTGDLPAEEQVTLLGQGNDLMAEVLKIAHHGSRNSFDRDFTKQVNPRYAVIQVGADNTFGHPNQVVINYLKKLGIKILRTDQSGDIKFNLNNSIRPLEYD